MNAATNWPEKQIGANLKLLSGFPFPSGKFSNSEGFPLIRIRDILDSEIETYFTGPFIPAYVIKKGDILVGMDGEFNIVKWQNQDALLNQRILKVEVSDSKQLDIGFIYYWLQPFIRKVNDMTAATTVKHLSTKDLLKAKGKIPSVSSQHKIALILQTIDQSIEKTEALIEKYQQIKAGLMHDLFTRGIGADGKLRPPREQAPELYHETKIGWIPKEWHAFKIEELLKRGTITDIQDGNHGELHPKKSDFVEEGIPFIMASDISEGVVNFDKCYKISEQQYSRLRIGFSKPGDILLSHKASIGFVALVPNEAERIMLTPQVTYYRTSEKEISSAYLCCFMKSDVFQVPLKKLAQQSTRDYIGIIAQKALRIAFPQDLIEQEQISCRTKNIDVKLLSEKEHLRQLTSIKHGLMHDLLTGKVEVKAD